MKITGKILRINLEEQSNKVEIITTECILIQSHKIICCESVYVAQVDSNLDRFIDTKALDLKVKTSTNKNGDTETFFTLVTSKGYLDWRWMGESSFYSVDVDTDIFVIKEIQAKIDELQDSMIDLDYTLPYNVYYEDLLNLQIEIEKYKQLLDKTEVK